jgi:hypothetical protein
MYHGQGNPKEVQINKYITLIPISPKFLLFLNSYILPKIHSHAAYPQKKIGLFGLKINISFWGRKKQWMLWNGSLRVTSAFRMSVWCDVLNSTPLDRTNPSWTCLILLLTVSTTWVSRTYTYLTSRLSKVLEESNGDFRWHITRAIHSL